MNAVNCTAKAGVAQISVEGKGLIVLKTVSIVMTTALLVACSGNPSEIRQENMLVIGEVTTGPLGSAAYLAEQCIDGVPYYALVYRSRFAMANRYNAKGKIPTCLKQAPATMQVLKLVKLGEMGASKAAKGALCLSGIKYLYMSTLYSSALVVHRNAKGKLQRCK